MICDVIAGKPFSNEMCGFCTVMPICILIKETYIGYDAPEVPVKGRILPAIQGLILESHSVWLRVTTRPSCPSSSCIR